MRFWEVPKKQEVIEKDGEKRRMGEGVHYEESDRFSNHSLTRYPEPAGWLGRRTKVATGLMLRFYIKSSVKMSPSMNVL